MQVELPPTPVYSGPTLFWAERVQAAETLGQVPPATFRERIDHQPIVPGFSVAVIHSLATRDVVATIHDSFEFPALHLRLVVQGRDLMRVAGLPSSFEVSADRYAFYAPAERLATVQNAPGQLETQVTVSLSRERVEDILGPCQLAKPFLALMAGNGTHGRGVNPQASASMLRLAWDIIASPLTGDLRRLSLSGKAVDLLACVAADLMGGAEDHSRAGGERQAALHARELLESTLAAPPSLLELGRVVGLSPRALGGAFQSTFGRSVAEYVYEARMLLAREKLEQTFIPVKQLAAEVGYGHVSNFTAAFTRRFGAAPAAFRRRGLSVR